MGLLTYSLHRSSQMHGPPITRIVNDLEQECYYPHMSGTIAPFMHFSLFFPFYSCHDFTLLAMFLAPFFPLFAPSSRDYSSHSARNNKNII